MAIDRADTLKKAWSDAEGIVFCAAAVVAYADGDGDDRIQLFEQHLADLRHRCESARDEIGRLIGAAGIRPIAPFATVGGCGSSTMFGAVLNLGGLLTGYRMETGSLRKTIRCYEFDPGTTAIHLWNEYQNALLTVAVSQLEGPTPNGFQYRGTVSEGLSGKPWKLVDYLWKRGEDGASFDDLAEHIWGDSQRDGNEVKTKFRSHAAC